MKQLYITIVLLFCTNVLIGQDWRYDLFVPKYEQEILSQSNMEQERESRILRDLSFIGAYKELYELDNYSDAELENQVKTILDTYSVENAKSYIISQSENEQILIINESHHRPEHRKFTSDLLEDLYTQGYRYLALEAILSNQHSKFTKYPENEFNLGDTTIMSRGYPLMKSCSGTYVKEPAFGNMIRKAIRIGYKIIGYEKNGKYRELHQAQNIASVIERDPSAKIVIHCGYGHLIESPRKRNNGTMDTLMAGHVKEITGIDPFTIDQTSYYNLGNISNYVNSRAMSLQPQIFTKKNEVFRNHKIENRKYWDMTVIHPDYGFRDKRPRWLTSDTKLNRFLLNFDSICIKYPIRIKLLGINDELDAVPIDIIEVRNPSANLALYGEIEKAKIVVENLIGDRQIISAMKKSYD